MCLGPSGCLEDLEEETSAETGVVEWDNKLVGHLWGEIGTFPQGGEAMAPEDSPHHTPFPGSDLLHLNLPLTPLSSHLK